MKTEELSKKYLEKFSSLFHITSAHNALSILSSGMIWGSDPDSHANFSAVSIKPMLARETEVALEFEWTKGHKICYGDPFSGPRPDWEIEGPSKNVAYHVFQEESSSGQEDLYRNETYWQTNLYPESSGLIFKGVQSVLHEELPPQSIFLRMFSARAREDHSKRIWSRKVRESLNEYIGNEISVTKKM